MADHEATERAVDTERALDTERTIETSPTGNEAAAQRGSFLGFVAHEMRNPLSTALWSAELLARLSLEERGGARGEKLSGMCLRALQRLRSLVEDHFLAERLDVGGIPLRRESVSVKEVLAAVVGKMGGVQVTFDVGDVAVFADRALFERALDGLLAAAARGKSPVNVEAQRAGEVALLCVRGAPPAPDALEPPQKGTASDPTGRALALHVTLRIVRMLGGSLSATEEDYLLALPLATSGASPV